MRAVMGLMFFPRGGSAQVARYLARSLPGWDVTIACGSLGSAGDPSHAATFYAGLDVRPLDYSALADAPDPVAAGFQPSYEDRPGAPDRVFAGVDDADYERLVDIWEQQLRAAGAADADLLHLHHLTPINEAAERAFPDVPRIGHLHGTELLMLRDIDAGPPPGWGHAAAWAERMRRWARGCERLLVLSPDAVRRGPDPLRGRPPPGGRGRQGVGRGGGGAGGPRGRGAGTRGPVAPGAPRAGGGGAGSPKRRAAGTRAAGPAGCPPPRTSSSRSRRAECCSTSGASPRSSACPCSCARTPAPVTASCAPRRSCCSAASPASGREST